MQWGCGLELGYLLIFQLHARTFPHPAAPRIAAGGHGEGMGAEGDGSIPEASWQGWMRKWESGTNCSLTSSCNQGFCTPSTHSALVFLLFPCNGLCMGTMGMAPKMGMAKNWERAALGLHWAQSCQKRCKSKCRLFCGV